MLKDFPYLLFFAVCIELEFVLNAFSNRQKLTSRLVLHTNPSICKYKPAYKYNPCTAILQAQTCDIMISRARHAACRKVPVRLHKAN